MSKQKKIISDFGLVTILVNCQLISPKVQRGMGIFLLNLMRESIKQAPQHCFILATDSNSSSEYLRSEFSSFENVHIACFPSPGPIFEQFFLPILAVKFRCDFIMHGGNTASLPCLWLKLKNMLLLHDVYYKNRIEHKLSLKRQLGRWYRRFTIDIGINRTDLVATVSEYAKSQIHSFYPNSRNKKCLVTYNGSGISPPGLGPICKRPRLLLVTGTDPQKNLNFFLSTLRQHDDFMSVLEGVDIVGVSSAADISIYDDEKFNFLGYKTGEELTALYSEARIVAVPSLLESFGIPALEALHHGCKVLASNTGALPEVLGSRATYFAPSSHESIMGALSLALPCLAESKVVVNMPEHTSKFTWERSASIWLSEIPELL